MAKQPNFLIIVADDLGFSDTSAYGGEINTPNIKRLAQDGLRMTGFHTASACSPTRSMLLTSVDHHLNGIGQMAEHIARESAFKDKPGYEGYLNDKVAAVSEILKEGVQPDNSDDKKGLKPYQTLLSGKWHLGLTKESIPATRGFEKSWGLLAGYGNHYGYEPQLLGEDLNLSKGIYVDDYEIFEPSQLPKDFYSTDAFTDKLLEFFDERKDKKDERPFFSLLTYTAPHWPLQAPPEIIDKYKGKYDDGPEKLRERRLKSLVEHGLISTETFDKAHPMIKVWNDSTWDSLTDQERKESSRRMETYAAMIEKMDENIGRVLNYLEKNDELDNTFILFMSDNGAEGALLEAVPVMGDKMQRLIEKYFNNSIENIGKKDSFVWYGDRWAQAATAPSKLYKMWITEGGIRCPCIVRYPGLGKQAQNGAITHAFTTVLDIVPTVLDLAKIPHPGKEFKGRKVYEVQGKSWIPWLSEGSKLTEPHDEKQVFGWELFGQQAIRKGTWKAVFIPPPSGSGEWSLYEMSTDENETNDVAKEYPDKLAELIEHWLKYEAETGMVACPPRYQGSSDNYLIDGYKKDNHKL